MEKVVKLLYVSSVVGALIGIILFPFLLFIGWDTRFSVVFIFMSAIPALIGMGICLVGFILAL